MLRGLKGRYEQHHKVEITDDALVAAARLSDRYVRDRRLPDKAIDLIDEAASRLRIEMHSLPPDLKAMRVALVDLTQKEEEAGQERNYEAAAQLRSERLRWRWSLPPEGGVATGKGLDETVGPRDRQDRASWTGVPVSRIAEAETERLLGMEDYLRSASSARMRRSSRFPMPSGRARAGSRTRTAHRQLYLSRATGVGKTELPRPWLPSLDDEDALVQSIWRVQRAPYGVGLGGPSGLCGL